MGTARRDGTRPVAAEAARIGDAADVQRRVAAVANGQGPLGFVPTVTSPKSRLLLSEMTRVGAMTPLP